MTEQPLLKFPMKVQHSFQGYQLHDWVVRIGLKDCRPALRYVFAAREISEQAYKDGLGHLMPIIALYNKPPAEIKKIVGGHHWHKIRTANITTNAARFVLRIRGGWSMDEAMLLPPKKARQANHLLSAGKTVGVMACRFLGYDEKGGLFDLIRLIQDTQRMGVVLDPTWGKKRLIREHDAAAMLLAYHRSDPTPFAEPWRQDVGDYIFTQLTSPRELQVEGALMKHCVGSYAHYCKSGNMAIFSVQGPERATLAFGTHQNQYQLLGRYNKKVSRDVHQAANKLMLAHLEYAETFPKASRPAPWRLSR